MMRRRRVYWLYYLWKLAISINLIIFTTSFLSFIVPGRTKDDIMQDYEYYEAHAKDIKLENITSSQNNAEILAMVHDNDPEFTDLCIFNEVHMRGRSYYLVREGDHMGWLGYFVGKSQHLEALSIVDFPENINLNTFLRGLENNRSIQDLSIFIDLGDSFQSLIPFLRNNDRLRHLNFNYFDIGLQCARNISFLLGQQISLKRLTFEETNLDGEGLEEIAAALRSQPIEELCLCSTNMRVRSGYASLGKALEGCPSFRKLELSISDPDDESHDEDEEIDDEDIGDEGLLELVARLKLCHNITSLKLAGKLIITEEVSRSLSTLFQSETCQLEDLDINRMDIDDDEMAVLATGLVSLPSLKRLNLRGTSIGDLGLQALVGGLVNCNLEEIDLSDNILSVSGLRALGTLVGRTANMRALCLFRCSVTDEGLQSVVEGMVNCCSLKELYLSDNDSITANGLASLSSLLQAVQCSLRVLFLHGINIGDDGAEILANGLIGNTSLTELGFSQTDSGITARGWAAFSKLLCDTSSVNKTYLSNHTLERIGGYGTPSDIVEVLKLNKSLKHAVAICKILRSHPDIDVRSLFEFDLMCLPLVVVWLEKAKPYLDEVNESPEVFKNRQLSAVFKFIRGMPQLAAKGFRSQKVKDAQLQLDLKSKERKLDQTV